MKDAYEVLGISHTASDDEVKQAYREMLRKYHPDNFAGTNNPLAPLAEEKFKEAQEAYNEILKVRSMGYYGPLNEDGANMQSRGNYNRGPQGPQGNYGGPGAYGQGGYNGQDQGGYNQQRPGSYQQGGYQQPYQQNYQDQGEYYGRPANYNGMGGCGTGNLCCDLWCADTLCECMGGDLCNCL